MGVDVVYNKTTCYGYIEFITEELFTKNINISGFLKLESIYKSNQDQAERLGFILDRESLTQISVIALI